MHTQFPIEVNFISAAVFLFTTCRLKLSLTSVSLLEGIISDGRVRVSIVHVGNIVSVASSSGEEPDIKSSWFN